MTLLSIYLLDTQWFAMWMNGCDVMVEAITFADALWLETLL